MNGLRHLALLVMIVCAGSTQANDNVLAHRLFAQGEYAQSAEIFTDPSWKGIALYRSSQWWRAAEAFVRANDAVSAFNLGNCYVKLGYYALALDAYQRALVLEPTLDDAMHNAHIMRQLLADQDSGQQGGGRQPSGDEIDRLDTEDESADSGSGEGGSEQADISDSTTGTQSEPGTQSLTPNDNAQAGQVANASDAQQQVNREPQGQGSANGQSAEDRAADNQASGGSESKPASDVSQAAGQRAALESEQATTQWLNRIHHDSQLFLSRRIKLEDKRRRASGQSAPAGGSSW